MWKRIKIDESQFLTKHVVDSNTKKHKILVTNYVDLWFEEIQEADLLSRCKEMNKLIEAADDVFLGQILLLVAGNDDENNVERSFSDSVDGKVLTFQTKMEGFKFKFKNYLSMGNNAHFYEEITLPLLTVVAELEKRHNTLVDTIKSKDLELQEYKLECGRISRKAVETDQFDLELFSAKCAEDLSGAKSNVIAQPLLTLTPFLQDLLIKINAAPVFEITSKEAPEERRPVEIKVTTVKLKSPSKNKKLQMYEDDEEDEDQSKMEEHVKKGEVKVKQENENKEQQRCKGKSKAKIPKVLPNL